MRCGHGLAVAVLSLGLLAGCTTSADAQSVSLTTKCTRVDGKADRKCNPGATNPLVTQDNIRTTICAPPPPKGQKTWTQSQRPPVSYTNALKISQMRDYGDTGAPADDEEDHIIALSIGGNPRDPHNLYPQPWNGPRGAHVKDDEERTLWHAVCAPTNAMSLATAQAKILADWTH